MGAEPPPEAELLDFPKAVRGDEGDNAGDFGPGAADDTLPASWTLQLADE
ncbi:MAG: hypothetical protein ACRCYU_16015 [Nocardioides sp.]